ELSSGGPEGEKRVRLGPDSARRRVLSLVPVEQPVIPGRDRRALRLHLGPSPGLVRGVTGPIEAPAARCRLDQHPIAGGVRRAIGDAVQKGVNVDARPQLRGESLLPRPFDDLRDREVLPVRVLAMKEGGGQPYFVGHLQFVPGFVALSELCCRTHRYNVSLSQTNVKTQAARCPPRSPSPYRRVTDDSVTGPSSPDSSRGE